MKLSNRDKVAYIGQNPYVPVAPYTSNPALPQNSQESNKFLGISDNNEFFCPRCKDINLLSNTKDSDSLICPKCNSRYSKRQFNVGGNLSRETGILDLTPGGNMSPDYHKTEEFGGGSWSTELGK